MSTEPASKPWKKSKMLLSKKSLKRLASKVYCGIVARFWSKCRHLRVTDFGYWLSDQLADNDKRTTGNWTFHGKEQQAVSAKY
jgi:hypothetical protein